MNLISVLLALTPVLLIFLLLVLRRMAADLVGLIGWVITILIAWLYFQTPLVNTLRISWAGVIASFPITLMVATSILQITIMLDTGAIQRVVVLVKSIAARNQIIQIMIINVGFGTLLAAMGATPVSILPPILIAMGYTPFVAIALPAIGYDALCTYALLGIPVVVFSGFVNLPVSEVGKYFARYMPVISTCIALGMLWIVGKGQMLRRGFLPALITGITAGMIAIGMNAIGMVTLTGVAAGLGVILVMVLYLKIRGYALLDRSVLSASDIAAEKSMLLWTAISPWIILTTLALLVNAPFLPLFDWTFNKLAMPVEIIPNTVEKMRVFWQAYFLIFVSTLLALPLLKPTRLQINSTVRKWLKRAPRPMFASAVFFAIAYLYNHSGKGVDWQLLDADYNMVTVLATASANTFGELYPMVAPYLGLLSGFISGSESSAIAMLTKLHLATADQIGAIGILIAAASGIGGGLASVISPAKLQNAAASIDRIGEEARVIPTTFIISVLITLVCAVMTLLWAYG